MLPAGTLTAGGYYQFQLTAAYALGHRRGDRDAGLLGARRPDERAAVVGHARRHGARRRLRSATVLRDPYDFAVPRAGSTTRATCHCCIRFYYAIFGAATEYQLVSNTPADNYDGALLPCGGGNASIITCIG